jgi:hypothetical protein
VLRGVEFIEGIIFLSISITYFGLETLEDVTWDFARWLMLTQRRWHLANFFIWIVISRPPKGRTQFIFIFFSMQELLLVTGHTLLRGPTMFICAVFTWGTPCSMRFHSQNLAGLDLIFIFESFLSQKIRQKPVMFCIMYVYILTGSTIDLQIRVLEIHFNWFNQFNHLKCNEETILSNDFVGIKGQFHN